MIEIIQTVISTPLSSIILATFVATIFAETLHRKL
jgi:hypothetical protein